MGSKVLLADDSITIQKIIKLSLADEGYEVVTANDGEAAKRQLSETAPDIVLVDSSLPAVDGYQLCEYVKQNFQPRRIPVVLLVGAFEDFNQIEARRVHADAYLTKPTEARALIDTIRSLIQNTNGNSHAAPVALMAPRDADEHTARETEDKPEPMPVEVSLASREHERASAAQSLPADDASEDRTDGEAAAPPSFFKKFVPPMQASNDNGAGAGAVADEKRESNTIQTELHRKGRAAEGALLVVWAVLAFALVTALAIWLLVKSGAFQGAQQSSELDLPPAQQEPAPAIDSGETQLSGSAPSEAPVAAAVESESASAQPSGDKTLIPNRSKQTEREAARREAEQATAAATAAATAEARALERERMLARARDLENRGSLDQAEQVYRAIQDRFPNDAPSGFALARLQASRAAQQRDASARRNRESGLNAFRSGDYAAAAASLNEAVKAGRADTATLYSLGMSDLKLGRAAEARAAFERCLSANPSYAPALVGLAQVSASAGKTEQAVALLKRALELGGGAEFTPYRIREMISRLNSRPPAKSNR